MGNCGSSSKDKQVSDPAKVTSSTPASSGAAPVKAAKAAAAPVPGEEWKKVHSAVRWNKVEEAKALLTGPDAVNCVDPVTKNLPIHIAAQNGHYDLLKFLVEKGALVNAKNGKDNTPLHMAIGYDYYECGQYLVSKGADVNLVNAAGIPANRGLEGDKCFGLAALISAEKSKVPEDALKALLLCKQEVSLLDKAAFAAAGMKTKKTLGPEWTSVMADEFKSIMMQL